MGILRPLLYTHDWYNSRLPVMEGMQGTTTQRYNRYIGLNKSKNYQRSCFGSKK